MKINVKAVHTLLIISLMAVFGQCKKEEAVAPDPLANAAGVYMGNMAEGTKIISGVKATVTTEKGTDGVTRISSVGFSSPSYQVVLTGCTYTDNCKLVGTVNGFQYVTSGTSADGKTLNVRGTSTKGTGTTSAISIDFSFTGTR